MTEYNNLMELVLDVGNHIYETHKRETFSFTQQLYEEQKLRNEILKERNKEWDALLKECEK
jgi:hypothetical protein